MDEKEREKMANFLLEDFKYLSTIVDCLLDGADEKEKEELLNTKADFEQRINNLGLIVDSYKEDKKR